MGSGRRRRDGTTYPLVYGDLRKLASWLLQGERPHHTLQPTALVNEAYLRLAGDRKIKWQNRAHFFAVASRVMRHILIDYARQHNRSKRGGGAEILPLDEALVFTPEISSSLLALNTLCNDWVKPTNARLVSLSCVPSVDSPRRRTGEVLHISPHTVVRDWVLAKAWLRREIKGQTMDPEKKWRRVDELFHLALAFTVEERRRFLEDACQDNPEIFIEVSSLLANHFFPEAIWSLVFKFEKARGAFLLQSPRFIAGKVIDDYEIVSFLGSGGMGEVYFAQDLRLARKVAIKVLTRLHSNDSGLMRRLRVRGASSFWPQPSQYSHNSCLRANPGGSLHRKRIRGRYADAGVDWKALDIGRHQLRPSDWQCSTSRASSAHHSSRH